MAELIAWILLALAMLIAAVDDYRTGMIHNRIVYPALLLGLVYWTLVGFLRGGVEGAGDGLGRSALALLAGAAPMAIIFASGALGGGDVKLMGVIGALSGRWECVLGAAVYGFLLAGLMALAIMLRHRVAIRTLQRLFGAVLTFVAGVKPNLPDDSPRVPLGVPLGLGAAVAGAEVLLGLRLPWTPAW